jgi:hypothetical protein
MENENDTNVSDDNVNENGTASGVQENGNVSYTTYKKTLTQLKNLQEKHKQSEHLLGEFEKKEQELEKKRLEEQGEYKKLLEMERQKIGQYESERDEYKNRLITAHKLNAFTEKLPSKISKPQFYDHIPLNDIVIDPETGVVDETSVNNAVNFFVKEYHQLLEPTGKPLPSDSPSVSGQLSYQQWLKLPVKEKRARINEVID